MHGKTIVITGSSSGLGECVATKLAAEGAKVVLVDRNKERLHQVASTIGAGAFLCDVASREQVQRTTQDILAQFGTVDVLINNAGVWTDEMLEISAPELRRKAFEVNALGTIEFTKALEASFREQNSGHILNVISVAGTDSSSAGDNTSWQTYGASKWAVAGFTRALKDSLVGTKIKVTGFYPGGFDSDLYASAGKPPEECHDQPWMMRVADVADALIFCLARPDDMLVEKLVVTKFGMQ